MAKKENKDTLYKLARITEVRPRFFRSLKNPKKMLELGCGHGPYTLQVQRYHPDVKGYGVDILDPSQAPEHLEYLRVDLNTEDLPYDDDMFDLIVFTHVMEHLEDPIRLGPKIHRILKPGGSIFVETPNWTTMFMPSFGIQRHLPSESPLPGWVIGLKPLLAPCKEHCRQSMVFRISLPDK